MCENFYVYNASSTPVLQPGQITWITQVICVTSLGHMGQLDWWFIKVRLLRKFCQKRFLGNLKNFILNFFKPGTLACGWCAPGFLKIASVHECLYAYVFACVCVFAPEAMNN